MPSSLPDLARRLGHLSIRIVGELVAPPTCAACDVPLSRRSIFCNTCASTVVRDAEGGRSGVIAASAYGGAVAQAIRRFKYAGRVDLAEPLSHLLRAELQRRAPCVDVVVPVPLHPRRLAERGFNQAALIAAGAAEELCVRLAPRALERVRFAAPQASLGRDARSENLDGAFAIRSASAVAGRSVLLVDDVVTTGATLRACERALLDAGATEVHAAAVAATPLG